jgi:4-amino-4-deoxy-L-arabinose transferase-like glycosyltransferase
VSCYDCAHCERLDVTAPARAATPRHPAAERATSMSTTRYVALLLVVVGVALVARVALLDAYPPGLHFDQAANGLLGQEVLTGVQRPVFFQSYTGREALFMYVIAATTAVFGPGVVALRLASALPGVATVAAVALLGAVLFNRRHGIVAAAFVAGMYWHIHVSRLGERTILVPLLDALALLALWQAFRRRSWALAAVGGGLTGLQLYTYPSSRFFPFVLIALVLIEGALAISARYRRSVDWAGWRSNVGLVAVTTVSAVIATLPLARYFYRHPEDFLGRAGQVAAWNPQAAGPSMLAIIADSTLRTLGMFFVQGDPDWKYNLAGQPVFDPITATFFLLGVVVGIANWRRREHRLCLIWLIGMLVPGFLSIEAPQFMRTLGAVPAAALLAATGLTATVDWLRRQHQAALRSLALALLMWPVVAGAVAGYQYFAVWAPSAAAYEALEGDVRAAAEVLRARAPEHGTTYVASRHGPNPTIAYLAGDVWPRLRWFDGLLGLPIPTADESPALYVLPRTATDRGWLERLGPAERVDRVMTPHGEVAVDVLLLEAASPLVPAQGSGPELDVGGIARLVGVDVPMASQAGSPIQPLFHWRLERAPAESVKFFAHLVDANGDRWAQYDVEPYPIDQWRAGQGLIVSHPLQVPDYVPPGAYTLRAGIARANGASLPVRNEAGQPAGTYWQSPPIQIIRPARPPDPDRLGAQRRLDVAFGEVVRLIGVSLAASDVSDGDRLAVTLFWQVTRAPGGDLATTLRLVGADGSIVAQSARPPTGGVWPARHWQAGDVVVDRQSILVPPGAPAGVAALTVDLLDANGRSLAASSRDATTVGQITVRSRPRAAAPVSIARPHEVAFDGGIRLLGYDVEPAEAGPGQDLRLTLYWQTDQPIAQRFTVFTHLLGADGTIVAQHDGQPARGERPTASWRPGETIVDPHPIAIPAGAVAGPYRLAIGLYDAETGERVPALDGRQRIVLD